MSDETDPSRPDDAPTEGAGSSVDTDQAAEIEAAVAQARARLAEVPAEMVVVNHVMGLYELAAIHLSGEEPDLAAASLAIDSMGLLVDGLGDRLGDDATTMRDALANIRMAYVGVRAQHSSTQSPIGDEASDDRHGSSDDRHGSSDDRHGS